MRLRRLNREPEPIFEDQPDAGLGVVACGKCGFSGRGFSICHCSVCHETFTAIGGFDDHRTGSHAKDTRTCRTPEQMRERGYAPNEKGYWRQPMTGEHWSN